MDLILRYSDDEGSDSPPTMPQVPASKEPTSFDQNRTFSSTKLTADYFGLNSSSDDDECPPRSSRLGTRIGDACAMVDTLVNAYQLSDTEVGTWGLPERGRRPSGNEEDGLERRPPKRSHHPDVSKRAGQRPRSNIPDMGSANAPMAMKDETEVVSHPLIPRLDPRLFETHPLVVPLLGVGTLESSLPGNRTWDTLTGHRGCVNTLDWGRSSWSHLLVSASMDGTVRIWNGIITDQKPTPSLWTASPHDRTAVRCARWSPTGYSIATGGYDGTARLTDVERGCSTLSWTHPHLVTCLLFHPQTQHLMVTGSLGQITCWDMRDCSLKAIRTYRADFNEVQDIAFLNDGNEFLCCTNSIDRDAADKTIMAWDFRTGAILSNQIFQERYHCTRLRVHPSKNWFVSQTNGNYIALFSCTRPYKMHKNKRFEGHKVDGYWVGCDISSDGRYVYSGSADGSLYAYNFKNGNLIKRWAFSQQPCLAVECHPLLPSTVAVSCYDGKIYLHK